MIMNYTRPPVDKSKYRDELEDAPMPGKGDKNFKFRKAMGEKPEDIKNDPVLRKEYAEYLSANK